jgi:hypothetical protein
VQRTVCHESKPPWILEEVTSNLSKNVDYVLHSATPGDRPWVFVELKTCRSSANADQARTYAEHLGTTAEHPLGRTMEELQKDVLALGEGNKKYAACLIASRHTVPLTDGSG